MKLVANFYIICHFCKFFLISIRVGEIYLYFYLSTLNLNQFRLLIYLLLSRVLYWVGRINCYRNSWSLFKAKSQISWFIYQSFQIMDMRFGEVLLKVLFNWSLFVLLLFYYLGLFCKKSELWFFYEMIYLPCFIQKTSYINSLHF